MYIPVPCPSCIVALIKGWNPFMGMPCLSVALSLCPVEDLLNALRFWNTVFVIDVRGPKSVKARFFIEIGRSLQVNGQRSYTYEVRIPSCDVSLERSCQELSNDIQLMDPVTVIWPAGTFLRSSKYPIMWGVVGKVLSRAFQRCMTYAPCERFQNVDSKSLPNVHKTFPKRRHNV
jgi:hypothetical protein